MVDADTGFTVPRVGMAGRGGWVGPWRGGGGRQARAVGSTHTNTQNHKHSGHAELGKTRFDDGWDLGQWGRDDDGPFIDGQHSLMGWVCLFVCFQRLCFLPLRLLCTYFLTFLIMVCCCTGLVSTATGKTLLMDFGS